MLYEESKLLIRPFRFKWPHLCFVPSVRSGHSSKVSSYLIFFFFFGLFLVHHNAWYNFFAYRRSHIEVERAVDKWASDQDMSSNPGIDTTKRSHLR